MSGPEEDHEREDYLRGMLMGIFISWLIVFGLWMATGGGQ